MRRGLGCRARGCLVRLGVQLDAACFVRRRPVCREKASADLDLSHRGAAAVREVGVCVVPEPHGLVERSSKAAGLATASAVAGSVAAGCPPERFTAKIRSYNFSRFLDEAGHGTVPRLYRTKPGTEVYRNVTDWVQARSSSVQFVRPVIIIAQIPLAKLT